MSTFPKTVPPPCNPLSLPSGVCPTRSTRTQTHSASSCRKRRCPSTPPSSSWTPWRSTSTSPSCSRPTWSPASTTSSTNWGSPSRQCGGRNLIHWTPRSSGSSSRRSGNRTGSRKRPLRRPRCSRCSRCSWRRTNWAKSTSKCWTCGFWTMRTISKSRRSTRWKRSSTSSNRSCARRRTSTGKWGASSRRWTWMEADM